MTERQRPEQQEPEKSIFRQRGNGAVLQRSILPHSPPRFGRQSGIWHISDIASQCNQYRQVQGARFRRIIIKKGRRLRRFPVNN